MATNLEMEALRAKVAELETQLAARDAEIAQLKGEVKVESEPEVKVESEPKDKKIKKRKATPPVRQGRERNGKPDTTSISTCAVAKDTPPTGGIKVPKSSREPSHKK